MSVTNLTKRNQLFDGTIYVPTRSDLDKLRDEYRELSGKDADKRWNAARLTSEIDKLLEG